MPVTTAKDHYLGKAGCRRMNCAQAVISAFKERYDLDDSTVEAFGRYGGGNAPDGLCGAYFAVRHILEKEAAEKVREFEEFFLEHAGAVKCREIKLARKLSCVGCVEKSSEFLAEE